MRIKPIELKFGKPTPKPISFGIYQKTIKSAYGTCVIGEYKGDNIKIYTNKYDKTKLFYISDRFRNWIKSKLIYFENGVKKIKRSKAK